MMERLMEASNQGYFDATEEELSQIREAYLRQKERRKNDAGKNL